MHICQGRDSHIYGVGCIYVRGEMHMYRVDAHTSGLGCNMRCPDLPRDAHISGDICTYIRG